MSLSTQHTQNCFSRELHRTNQRAESGKMIKMMNRSRFLVISDTHGDWPYKHEAPPQVDVLLRCGDLTKAGGLSSLKIAMENVKSVDVELKLVITGNHDLDLHKAWVRSNPEHVEEDLEHRKRCVEYMKSLDDLRSTILRKVYTYSHQGLGTRSRYMRRRIRLSSMTTLLDTARTRIGSTRDQVLSPQMLALL
jgi:hypothetical protein